MTNYEFQSFLAPLELSVRSHNILVRAYHEPDEWEIKYNNKAEYVWQELSKVENYQDLKNAIEKTYRYLKNFGKQSYEEVMQKIEATEEVKKKEKWHKITDLLPVTGIPLAVKTNNHFETEKPSIKYPVYYVKDPYTFDYKWVFCAVCETPSVLLPDYSEVKEWAYMEDLGE